MYHTPSSRCVKYVLKIFQTKIMKNEIFKNVLGKGHLCLTKGHLDKPKGQVRLNPPNQKLLLTLLIQIKKK